MPAKRGRGRPRKTPLVTTKEEVVSTPKSINRSVLSRIQWSESYTSLLMGVVVIIVAVLFVVSFLRQTRHIQDTTSISTAITPTITQQLPSQLQSSGQKMYTVVAGDSLWTIAERFYQSGYNWVDIAKANNLSDPSTIHSGNNLIIPSVTPQPTTIAVKPQPVSEKSITGNTYTIQHGDTLWDISVRAYADGYKWSEIARVNNLSNPNLIFSGNVITIPR